MNINIQDLSPIDQFLCYFMVALVVGGIVAMIRESMKGD